MAKANAKSPSPIKTDAALDDSSDSSWGGDSPPVVPPPPPPAEDPDYEVIEVASAAYMNGPPRPPPLGSLRRGTGRHCDLCGGSTPVVRCDLCSGQIFCSSCDDMYHRHPKRQSHVRRVLETTMRPPLPPRGEIGMAPVPPPRSRQKRTTTLFRLSSTGGLLSSLGKERQESIPSRKEFSLSEKMGSLRRMMGSRPLPPTPPQSHMISPRNPMTTQSNQRIDVESPSKFHTMREGVGHSSFRHNSDFMSRWRHPSLSNPPQSPTKSPALNGHRRTSMGDLWEQGSARESSMHHPSSMEHGGHNWQQSNSSEGRLSPSPWGQQSFVENGTATLNRRRRSEMSPTWNGWQRGGMVQSTSVTDLHGGMAPWGGPGGIMQQTQSMAHLHCPGCVVNPAGHTWSMPIQDHWHCGAGMPIGNMPHSPSAHGWGGSLLQLWPHHPPPPPVVVSPNVPPPEIRHHANEGDWNSWEEGAEGKMGAADDAPEQTNNRAPDVEGTEDKTPLFVPSFPWSCEHCTYVNQAGTRVCAVCCKTPSSEIEQGKKPNSNLQKESKDWSDARSQVSQKTEGERPSVKGMPKDMQQENKKLVQRSNEAHDDQSSQEGSVITAVQDLESNRWKSYSPRPQKRVVEEKHNHFRRISRSPTMSTSTNAEEVVKKVSMGVGTSPPREMKVEKKSSIKGSMTSVGTSPPPQSISTQTYETPPTLKSSSTGRKTSEFGSQYSVGQDMSLGGQGSVGQYVGSSRRLPRLRRTLSLTLASKQRETTPNAFLRSQSRHSICGNSGDQSTPEPPVVPVRRRLPSSSTSSEYYNPSGEADGEWSGGDDDRKEKDKVHGLELVRLLREAEQLQFTAEELEVALKHCSNKTGTAAEGGKGPLAWLKANWLQMVDTVATLATNFGLERRENTVGTVSTTEARESLRKEGGDVWAAVTHCVEARQRKYAELVSRGNFTREDIVSALTNSHGNVEIAFNELSKSQLKPFLMRIWGPPVSGTGDNESGNSAMQAHSRTSSAEEINNIIEQGGKGITTEVQEEGKTSENVGKLPVVTSEVGGSEVVGDGKASLHDTELPKETAPAMKSDEVERRKETVPLIVVESDGVSVGKEKEVEIPEERKGEETDGKSVQSEGCERLARQLLAEGHVNSYERAEIAAILVLKENTSKDEALIAVQECTSVDSALSYLRQECLLCSEQYPMNQMVSMLTCVHRCCQDCARLYFTVQIRDRSIEDAVCPFCKEPNFPKKPVKKGVCDIEEVALNYYSNLDILLKGILDPGDHELFQRKLRDRTLANDPNFRWCTKCSSGFFADPRQKRLACPDCKSVTCASCSRPWAKQHDGVSCELFARWLEENDPATQAAGLARHISESSEAMLSCPHCNSRFALARGGCMHLTCPQCRHEFCSGCGQTFAMGTQCTEEMDGKTNKSIREGEEEEEEEGTTVAVALARGQGGHPCARLGLHAHHPRDCLFYLRDMEAPRLQKLLKDNGVEYNTKNPQAAKEEGSQKNKSGIEHMKCQVQVQREGPAGLIDGFCEEDVPEDHAGLCRLHYIEYLVGVMRRAGLDPAPLFDQQEAVAELRRRHVTPPDRPKGTPDEDYRQKCIEMIQRMIPLKNTAPTRQDK